MNSAPDPSDPRRRVGAAAAWYAIAGQFVFVGAWLLSGGLQDHYSHLEQYVSELGASTMKAPWIVNAGLVVLGSTFIALAAGLRGALPRTRSSLVAISLFVVCGAAFALAGPLNLDCAPTLSGACERRLDAGAGSWHSEAHYYLGWVVLLGTLAIPFALAWATRGGRAARPALVAGLLGVVIVAVAQLGEAGDATAGLAQRFGLGAMQEGLGLVAIALLVWSGHPRPRRRRARAGGEGALEPFRFLAPHLRGSGETAYAWWVRPFRLPRHFDYTRRVDYPGEAEWVIHDELRYEDGTSFELTLAARPLTAERMRLWGQDMPGGGETVLVPGGLELEPCWILVPWWGISWPVRWRGRFRLTGPDTLEAGFAYRLFGFVPAGEVSIRAATPAREPANA
jgi:uncharacterized protein DUF998